MRARILVTLGLLLAVATWMPLWLFHGPMSPADASRVGRWMIAGGLLAICGGALALAFARTWPVRIAAVADLLLPIPTIGLGLLAQVPMGP